MSRCCVAARRAASGGVAANVAMVASMSARTASILSGSLTRAMTSKSPGSRVVDVKVNGQPLNETRKYTFATSTFIALDGGDGYTMFKGAPVLVSPDKAPIDSEALRRMFVAGKAISPKVEGRIKRLDTAQKAATDCK